MKWFVLFLMGVIGASWAFMSSETALLVTIMGVILGILSLLLGWRGDKLIRGHFSIITLCPFYNIIFSIFCIR